MCWEGECTVLCCGVSVVVFVVFNIVYNRGAGPQVSGGCTIDRWGVECIIKWRDGWNAVRCG